MGSTPFQQTGLTELAGKLESSKGTAEALTAADNDVRAYDIQFDGGPEFDDENSKYAQGNHAEYKALPGMSYGTCSFKVKMAVHSSDQVTRPLWYKYAEMCGLSVMGWDGGSLVAEGSAVDGLALVRRKVKDDICGTLNILTPSIGTTPVFTVKQLVGCMGNMVITCDGVGKPWIANFNMFGKLGDSASTDIFDDASPASPATTGDDQTQQVFMGMATTIGGTSIYASKWQFDLGNTIQAIPKQDNFNGIDYHIIKTTNPRFSIDPLATKVATKDWLATALTHASTPIVVGTLAASKFTLEITDGQLTKLGDADRDGIKAYDLSYRCLQNGIPGTKIDAALDQEDTFVLTSGLQT